jgi:hypothetical protein
MPVEKHVAILGGGAAGLSAAYFLHGRTSVDGNTVFRCTVFDVSPRLGGNCQSAYLGRQPYTEPFADLGVNDFNTERYLIFMEVLKQLALDGYPVPHAPLIDTTTWSTPREVTKGARTYTDEEMAHWELHPDKPWLKNIALDWDRFQSVAYQVLHDPKYANMSVDEFIADQGYSHDFAEYNLRARINGMYYVNDRSPGSMPIRAVMSYYHLQEGIGTTSSTVRATGSVSSCGVWRRVGSRCGSGSLPPHTSIRPADGACSRGRRLRAGGRPSTTSSARSMPTPSHASSRSGFHP